MWVIVAYDVSTNSTSGRRRLRRVAQVCVNYGQRVQKSVFECQVNEVQFEELRRKLLKEINKEEDNLRLYRMLGQRDRQVEEYGKARTTFFDEPLVV